VELQEVQEHEGDSKGIECELWIQEAFLLQLSVPVLQHKGGFLKLRLSFTVAGNHS
jgi:hypothetical protein